MFQNICPTQSTPKCTEEFNIVSGPIWMTPVSNPTHVLQVNQCAPQIYVLPVTSGRVLISEVHISAHNATPFWTISYSTVGRSCSFLQRIICIHCMASELCVPFCPSACRPQRETNVNYARSVSDTHGPHDESMSQPLRTLLVISLSPHVYQGYISAPLESG